MVFFAITEFEGVLIVALAAIVLMGIFWMVVGWRAMRAHERLAESHEALSRIGKFFGAKFGQSSESNSPPAPTTARPAGPEHY